MSEDNVAASSAGGSSSSGRGKRGGGRSGGRGGRGGRGRSQGKSESGGRGRGGSEVGQAAKDGKDGKNPNRGGGGRGRGRSGGRGRGRTGGRGRHQEVSDKTPPPAAAAATATAQKKKPSNDESKESTKNNNNARQQQQQQQCKDDPQEQSKNKQQGGRKNNQKESNKDKNKNNNKQKQSDNKKGNDSAKTQKKDKQQDDKKKNSTDNKGQEDKGKKGDQKAPQKDHNKATGRKSDTDKNKAKDNNPYSTVLPPNQSQQTSDINYGKGETITILHVAEKPSIAQAIAHGLCSGKPSSYKDKGMPIFEFDNPDFPKAPHAKLCRHRVTSVAGHVFSVDFAPQYQSWDSVDPMELFDAPIVRKPCSSSMVYHLQSAAKAVNFIVLWLDCDREGENINFEVLDCCMNYMKADSSQHHSHPFDRVYRAYFSAINPSDIQKAYRVLGKPDKNQSLSVDARQELDLKVGVAFSRFQTRFFQGRYGNLDSAVLSYGPCQTPTLGFCVQRYVDIETFTAQPYWVLELNISKRGRTMRALWGSGRSFNRNKVLGLQTHALEQTTSTSGMVKVVKVARKDKKQGRPVPLNTVALLKACSKALGVGPHSAMQAAERLYLSGYLSYPRTESTAYPQSFDITGTLQQQASDFRWGAYVRDLLKAGHNKSRGGVDMGDHPPITPCRAVSTPNELSGDMARVYDLVVRHFIASVSPDAVWKSSMVEFELESLGKDGQFTLRGKELVSPGFLTVLLHKEYGDEGDDDDEDEEERAIAHFDIGEIIPLINSSSSSNSTSKVSVASGEACRASLLMKEKMTTPPSLLTESELISLMERNGIGTDASIPTHIENIQKRNYVSLESGRRLAPSKLGLVLAQGYHLIDSSLVLPKVRSDIEGQCNEIAKGLASKDAVVSRSISLFKSKFQNFVESIDKMDVLFGSSFLKLEDAGKVFTRCGLSRRYLQYITGPPPRLYNKYTETVYPLPVGGVVKQWGGRYCPVEGCNFELCTYSVGQPARLFPLCPNCFNTPEWALDTSDQPEDPVDREDHYKEKQIKSQGGKMLTLECPLPDEHPLIEELTVSPDDEGGVFILDPQSGPKWKLVGTRSPTVITLPQCIEKVSVVDQIDEESGCHLMKIVFKEGQSFLPDKSSKYLCTYNSDKVLQEMSRVYHGSERTKAASRGGRGRGRGRGGRGGGRGGRGGRGRR